MNRVFQGAMSRPTEDSGNWRSDCGRGNQGAGFGTGSSARGHTRIGRYRALQALVRLHGTPVGRVTVPLLDVRCSATALRRAISREHGLTVIHPIGADVIHRGTGIVLRRSTLAVIGNIDNALDLGAALPRVGLSTSSGVYSIPDLS